MKVRALTLVILGKGISTKIIFPGTELDVEAVNEATETVTLSTVKRPEYLKLFGMDIRINTEFEHSVNLEVFNTFFEIIKE